MTLSEKANYLKGLVDGLGIDDSTPTGKVLLAMNDLLTELSEKVDAIDADIDDVVDFCNTLDEDMDALEEEVSEIEDDLYGDDEDDEDECDEDCCCDDCGDDCYEVVCPTCGDTIELTEEMVNEGSIVCPNCGENLEFDLEEVEDCDCGCGCDDEK
ncbi:MAG TPA: hypothetical protein IAC39_07370 [Candidatus Faeciplasma pullistercoris]|uniref:TFIIB-type domain-containing protein n=1 Tax=Candidatus Faeciplasma pullistercoris TaxID=2840800 RepID=A0A9D1KKR0_9FIRM|nr:hypothetical protein [Candidatus Faeciplasma pullistercoris]